MEPVEGAQPRAWRRCAQETSSRSERATEAMPVQESEADGRAVRDHRRSAGSSLPGSRPRPPVVHRVGDVVRQILWAPGIACPQAPPSASAGYYRRRRVHRPRVGQPGQATGLDPRYLQIASGGAREVQARRHAARADDLGFQARDDAQGLGVPSNLARRSRQPPSNSPLYPKGSGCQVVGQTAASTTSPAPSSLPARTWATSREVREAECARNRRDRGTYLPPSSRRGGAAPRWRRLSRAVARSNSVRSGTCGLGRTRSESAGAYGRRASPPSTPRLPRKTRSQGHVAGPHPPETRRHGLVGNTRGCSHQLPSPCALRQARRVLSKSPHEDTMGLSHGHIHPGSDERVHMSERMHCDLGYRPHRCRRLRRFLQPACPRGPEAN